MAFSRTCNLRDFTGCVTVATWQQRLAEAAWRAWTTEGHVQTRLPSLCCNWSGAPFEAPGPTAIYQLRGQKVPLVPAKLPAVYGLNVLDHLDAPVRFLVDSADRLRPGGLLFLTFAFWDAEGPDEAVGKELRTRIYDATSEKKLLVEARRLGLQPFGELDWQYHGNTLDDHTLASLVLTKRGGNHV